MHSTIFLFVLVLLSPPPPSRYLSKGQNLLYWESSNAPPFVIVLIDFLFFLYYLSKIAHLECYMLETCIPFGHACFRIHPRLLCRSTLLTLVWGLLVFYYGHESVCWRYACCWQGWGSMNIVDPNSSHLGGSGGIKKQGDASNRKWRLKKIEFSLIFAIILILLISLF